MSPFLVCLLICFSMHACNARYLGLLSDKETRKQDFSKGVDKVINLHETSMISPITEEFEAQDREEVGKIDRKSGASTMEHKNVHDLFKEEGSTKEATSGNGHIISSRKDLQQTYKIEGLKSRERSMLESTPSDTEEAIKSNENDIAEDVVVMDYAQPHRKPPIHNEKA